MVRIDGHTRLAGVIGWPVEHTLSPHMQNPAIQQLGLNWLYVPLPVHPDDLKAAVLGARAMGFVGLNVTIPHKQAALELVDELDAGAQAIGALNTIHFSESGAIGYNTDAAGFTRTVELEGGFRFTGQNVLQLGAGGAGRAIAAGAAMAGAAKVLLFDVDSSRMRLLARDMAGHFKATQFYPLATRDQILAAAEEAQLIVNATPLGMRAEDPLPIEAECLTPRHIVFDAVYVPALTKLLATAAERGARVISGLGMLARQGARSLQIWSGTQPDEEQMLRLLRDKLGI